VTKPVRIAPLVLILSFGLLVAAEPPDHKADLAQLLDGVNKIGAPGTPGLVCVFGPQAFPVVLCKSGRDTQGCVVGAARSGKGRLVAFAHSGYFDGGTLKVGDTARLMANCARWAGNKKDPRVATWKKDQLRAALQAQGLKAKALAKLEAVASEADIVLLHTGGLKPAQEKALAEFVAQGGGLITCDCPWGWLQVKRKSLTKDHEGNRLLMPAGLAFADGYSSRTADVGFAATATPDHLVNASTALDLLEKQTKGEAKPSKSEIKQAGWSITAAARAIPADDKVLLPRLHKLAREYGGKAIPTPKKPLRVEDALARVLVAMQLEEIRRLKPEETKAHPAAAFFPGAVPAEAKRVKRELKIDGKVPGWHSTGLYAAPGEQIEVTLKSGSPVKGLAVRIGPHKDGIWHHDRWSRVPEITRQWPIVGNQTRIANAFGGLIYIVVPGGGKAVEVTIGIGNAVEAPLFVLGQTDEKDWRERIRDLPGPWAELATQKIILTVPSDRIRKLDAPEALMKTWDKVLDACAELATRPIERERPERIVSDVQISAGYMHSGYPVMTHLDAAARMVDRTVILRGEWGLFHELGHNHQSRDWTFGGTVEVTVNLFTLYVYEKVCGKKPRAARGNLALENRNKKLKKYLATKDFNKWKSDPFLALIMYVQLQESFGWETFKKLFAEYRKLPGRERPRSDNDKRDQWMVRFSRAIGKDLGPFFQAWGVPTSEKARQEIASLPDWMPPDWPKE
jgi:hypothetical protein